MLWQWGVLVTVGQYLAGRWCRVCVGGCTHWVLLQEVHGEICVCIGNVVHMDAHHKHAD